MPKHDTYLSAVFCGIVTLEPDMWLFSEELTIVPQKDLETDYTLVYISIL